MQRRNLLVMTTILSLVILVASGSLFAAGKTSAHGTLTAVEEDGTVIIDNRGYLLSPSARIEDSRKERITLRNLPLPSPVYFEYEFTKSGFVIILIREIAK